MVKYHYYKTRQEAENKQQEITKQGYSSTIMNFGKPMKKGYGWKVHEYKRKLPSGFR